MEDGAIWWKVPRKPETEGDKCDIKKQGCVKLRDWPPNDSGKGWKRNSKKYIKMGDSALVESACNSPRNLETEEKVTSVILKSRVEAAPPCSLRSLLLRRRGPPSLLSHDDCSRRPPVRGDPAWVDLGSGILMIDTCSTSFVNWKCYLCPDVFLGPCCMQLTLVCIIVYPVQL